MTKGDYRRYVYTVNPKYFGIIHKKEKKLAFYAALEVLKLEIFVDSDGLYSEKKDPDRK